MAEVLVGRGVDVALTSAGERQLRLLEQRFARDPTAAAIYCSPRRRTRETARAIAGATGAKITIDDAFDEVDFGAWTGRSFTELQQDEQWQHWNTARSDTRAPGGESMREAQARAVNGLKALVPRHAQRHVIVVSHAEIVRSLLLHYLACHWKRTCGWRSARPAAPSSKSRMVQPTRRKFWP